ncbi:DUF2147 domain-containing protein [Loktanella agnita]|uniref:DUF2147 domain-containing protein n=1 Tax=Loktanella agnita TaxID=287097 RepID=UPI0039870B78
MRKLIVTAAAAMTLAGAVFADPLEGVWQTVRDDNGNFGHIQVAPCGDALCGQLVRSFDSSGSEIPSDLIGRNIISETTPNGGGAYRGKVFSPDRDKTYNSRLQLNGDQLSVSGCVFGICRDGGTWVRVN